MPSPVRALLLLLLASLAAPAASAPAVPEPLQPWVPWVLDGHEDSACARLDGAPLCAWPGRLQLTLDERGGNFVLDVRADAPTALAIPGDTTHWPQDLRDGSAPAQLARGDVPTVTLSPGAHRISGTFAWSRLPESLPVPPSIALVELTLRGSRVANPRRDKDGLLWMQGGASEEAEEDRLAIEVHRRVDDGVPVIVTTRLKLRVSGRSREVSLPTPLLAGTEATFLSSSLPARLESDGSLKVQLRPGEWELQVDGRSTGPVQTLRAPQAADPWPAEETWVFQAAPAVRSVRVDGAPGVDPARTSLPADWRSLPAWRVARGTELEFVELRRGEAKPPPDRLSVQRRLWLSLDGQEFAVRDDVAGSLFAGGRLELQAPGVLGRATVGNQDQLITVGDGTASGVEVRDGSLQMQATSTWARGGRFPAVGWNRDAQSLTANLQLPPGWRLVAATGVDDARGAWLERWTLMDLFLVLLIALAVGQLTQRRWGAASLVLLLLCWQEDGALQWQWIALLVALGLLRVLPAGFARRVVDLGRWAVVLLLATQAVVFSWSASQAALFPQLGNYASEAIDGYRGGFDDGVSMNFAAKEAAPAAAPTEALLEEDIAQDVEQAWEGKARRTSGGRGYVSGSSISKSVNRASRLDPQAVVQTGPGLPRWSWTDYTLTWNGPVSANHEVGLILTGPAVNGVLGLLRVAGTVLLLLLLADPRRTGTVLPFRKTAPASGTALLLLGALSVAALTPDPAQAQELPDKELLGELQTRLLARPACEPNCAQLVELGLRADASGLTLSAEVHAEALSAWRLPGPDSAWTPARVQLDGADVLALRRSADGFLSVRVPPGVHRVVMSGPARDEVGLQFPGAPKVLRFVGVGWTIAGYRPDAPPPGSVQLSRARTLEETAEDGRSEAELAPWLQVQRELDLGVPWLVHNTLTRLGGGTRAVLAKIPLLPGEAVTSSGIPVEAGEAIVALEPGETVRRWDSTLTEADSLTLTAPADRPWTEVWSLDCSPIWSCGAEGLAPTRHLADGRWLPRWDPWPGEALTLTLRRPPPAEGVTTTIDHVKLDLTSGRRLLESAVTVSLRSSQGGEHAVTLPPGAALRSFQLDGRDHPAQPDGDRLVFAVEPGSHEIVARWSQDAAGGLIAKAPAVGVGASASNVEIAWTLPEHRWVLWAWGPRWGPVVTVWQYLLVLLLASFLLARFAPTPLALHDWLLLGLGLTQIPPAVTVFLVLWLVALSFRGRGKPASWWVHDGLQLALLGMTLIALGILYAAIYEGLVADPDLGVRGAGSYGRSLRWFADRSGATLPSPGVFWLPVWCWRLAMLLWSLWLASRLLRWLKWGWEQFSAGGLWTIPTWFRWSAPPASQPAAAALPGTGSEPSPPTPAPGQD